MADFRPETTVYLFKATGVDDENQPYFTSEGAKLGWYNAHSPKAFTDYSYQRENREYIRVKEKAENLRDYDMLAFKNSSGRYVFCRVEEVEFINPNTTQITYSVDYMQTYIDVVTFGKCWVEREMQQNDWNGGEPSYNNLQPEGIETGKMTRTRASRANEEASFSNFDLVVLSTYDSLGESTFDIKVTNGYPSGINAIRFAIGGELMTPLNTMLTLYADKGIDIPTAILGMYLIPHDYSDPKGGNFSKTITVSPLYPSVNGYTPVNAKCFTSEFCRLEISNRRGGEQELKPENFTETDNFLLTLKGAMGYGAGGSMLYPQSYEGRPEDFAVIKYDDTQAPFVSNGFASWLSANIGRLTADVTGSVLQNAVSGFAAAGVPGAFTGAIVSAGQAALKISDKAKDPASMGGQVSGSVLEILFENYGYSINWVHPYVQNLKSIDEFFSRFGYRTNRYKVPNVNTRPKWNYVKTAGGVCRGPFPKKAQLFMQNLLDKGVTFWHLGGGENISDDWDIGVNKE